MGKIRTIDDLQDYVDTEMGWRIKEVAHLTASIDKSSALAQRTMIRASIPLLYAHWEGFVKNTAGKYIEYISNLKLKYSDLEDCLIVLGMRKKLYEIASTNKHDIISESMQFILSGQAEKALLNFDAAIQTESNLKSHVFDNIAKSIGVAVNLFDTKYNFIDESLLKRRNCIAHGEYLDINANEWRELSHETLSLMRTFKNEVLNNASTKKYLKSKNLLHQANTHAIF